MELNDALKLKPAIIRTWNEIGSDLVECAAECGEDVSNEEALEACLDADRLLTNGKDSEANDLARKLVAKFGYDKVLKTLAKNIQLA